MPSKSFVLFTLLVAFLPLRAARANSWEEVPTNQRVLGSMDVAGFGLLAGEDDGRLWLSPYNGVYISKNQGLTWLEKGLSGRGVTDIEVVGDDVYASTHLGLNGTVGLFKSSDSGNSWTQIGPNFSMTTIFAKGATLLAGTYTRGLQASFDNGVTWEQKIGSGVFGPKILFIQEAGSLIYAGTETGLYLSKDTGKTWLLLDFFNDKTVTSATMAGSKVLLGTRDLGLFSSSDGETNWLPTDDFADQSVDALASIGPNLYMATSNSITHAYDILRSADEGTTWENTNLNLTEALTGIKTLKYLVKNRGYVYALTTRGKMFRSQVDTPITSTPFLQLPWTTDNTSELTSRIYSYFDHALPLLGYFRHKEPSEYTASTINYLGKPVTYYSSHDGYDFSLKYGTPLLAAAPGIASYYYCKDCGNAIKINHLNGYQTTYMHLQEEGLITKTAPATVDYNSIIGKVGMTGNTTGPHLHFSVLKDLNADGNFENDTPDGKVDPFAWFGKNKDPWRFYTWTDTLGRHTGTKSDYLWLASETKTSNYVQSDTDTLEIANYKAHIYIPQGVTSSGFTLVSSLYAIPQANTVLKYIEATSIMIDALDQLGEDIKTLLRPIKLEYALTDEDLINISSQSLKIYWYDDINLVWQPLQSIYDGASKTLSAFTNHLSWFAVFGEKSDNTQPSTAFQITTTSPPEIILTTNAPTNSIFYEFDSSGLWNEYTQNIALTRAGFITLAYRSMDNYGTLEETNYRVVEGNSTNKPKLKLTIKNAGFSTGL